MLDRELAPRRKQVKRLPMRGVVQEPRSRWIFQRQQLGSGMGPSNQFEIQLTE